MADLDREYESLINQIPDPSTRAAVRALIEKLVKRLEEVED